MMEGRSPSVVSEVPVEQGEQTEEGPTVQHSPSPLPQTITPPLYSYDADYSAVI